MNLENCDKIRELTKRLVWFKEVDDALKDPCLVLTQIMTHGTVEDVVAALELVGKEGFCQALDAASPGSFDPRSWTYWNLMCDRWPAPPLPTRQFPDDS